MNNSAEAVEQRLFKALVQNMNYNNVVILKCSEAGFQVILVQGENEYILHTQRKTVRVFKFPNTAISFVADLGVKEIKIEGLENWHSDFNKQ